MLEALSEKDREKLWILAIFFLAFALRIIYLLQIKANPHFFSPTMDPLYHDVWAQNIAGGNWIGGKVFFRAPFYAYFLAIVYKIFGHSYIIPRVLQHLIGSFSCVLVYFLARKLFNRRVAIVSGFIAATYGMLIYFEGELLLDSFLILFDLLLILFLLKARENPKFSTWFLCGIILGFSAITRPNVLVFVPIVWLWIFLVFRKKRTFKSVLTYSASFLLGGILIISPVTLRNLFAGGDFVLIASQGGINFLIGNNKNADGMSAILYKEDWQYRDFEHMAEKEAGKNLRPSEVSRFYYKKGINFLSGNPKKAFRLWTKKLCIFWNKFEVSNNQNVYFSRRYSSLSRVLPLGFWFIAPLALTGVTLSLRNRRRRLLPVLFIFSYMFTVIMFFVTSRFRLPVIPFLIIFSSFCLYELWERLRSRSFSRAIRLLFLIAIFSILTNSNFYHLSVGDFSQSYFSLGNVYLKAGELDKALEQYNLALDTNPFLNRVHLNKGIVFLRKKKYKEAEEEFWLELEKNPREDRAYNNLSVLYRMLRLYDKAIEMAQKAIELKVYYPEAYMNSALAFKEKGDHQKAREVIEKGLRNVRPFLDANYLMGEIYQAEGKLDSATQEYRKVLSQDAFQDIAYNLEVLASKQDLSEMKHEGTRAKAHFNLGTIRVQEGRIDLAESHLKMAISLEPDFAEAYANLGTLYDHTGRGAEGLPLLKQAVSLDSQNAVYHYNLGLAYAKQMKLTEAREEFETTLILDPLLTDAHQKLRLVDSLLQVQGVSP